MVHFFELINHANPKILRACPQHPMGGSEGEVLAVDIDKGARARHTLPMTKATWQTRPKNAASKKNVLSSSIR